MKNLLCFFAFAFLAAFTPWQPSVGAAETVFAVIAKKDTTYIWSYGRTEPLTETLMFPDKVEIFTNAVFMVAEGKERKLASGQMLRRDGWLVSADGAVEPVIDHVTMRYGKIYVVRDGLASPLTATMNFPNGLSLNPDGTGGQLPGGRARMLDGQLFRLDGSVIPSKDTVTLRGGRVVVQKDGSLITLGSAQIMGMNDGTRVYGRGTIQKLDGSMAELVEGQTVLIDGAFYGR